MWIGGLVILVTFFFCFAGRSSFGEISSLFSFSFLFLRVCLDLAIPYLVCKTNFAS